jgi:hypothetical protein
VRRPRCLFTFLLHRLSAAVSPLHQPMGHHRSPGVFFMHARMLDTSSDLLECWRHQFANQRSRNIQRRLRLAALGYLVKGPIRHALVQVEHLILVVLRTEQLDPGMRLTGYSAQRVEWGVDWGGPKHNPFAKDLTLEPRQGARGWRLDLACGELVRLGLRLERELERHARIRQLPVRRRVELPRLWAGFRLSEAREFKGDGPEFDAACRQTGKIPRQLFTDARKSHQGLLLFPLDWVSNRWEQAVSVFADLDRLPRRQVIRVGDPVNDLAGYRGAAHFDLLQSRFKQGHEDRQLIAA